MIQFNDLRISEDKKHLIIDVQISPLEYYENVYLGSICINTLDSYKCSTGFTMSGYQEGISREKWNITYEFHEPEKRKVYREYIDLESYGIDGSSLDKNLYFVQVTAIGTPTDDTPCGMKNNCIIGVTYDKYPLYLQGMNILSNILNCEVPRDALDYILRNKALKMNLKAGNYQEAVKYWDMLVNTKVKSVSNKCGCHGTI